MKSPLLIWEMGFVTLMDERAHLVLSRLEVRYLMTSFKKISSTRYNLAVL
ncbi:hypothetical protein SAMN05880501_107152 [Ureibacillus xyleni]|uniref:Uncharacterized protein n=1 Tax=Ureibacillus xyleni TaxID=614648 RepID=A0A285SYB5_9BACL|nr:hypothetical protein SAMN05880501_107152 [Ureibacillus xyleni]